jgi:SAM-dependent methyltransferase
MDPTKSDFWDRVAGLPGLSPVIDYQPVETPWARYITRLHLLALERGMELQPTDRFLDFGCGVGRITSWLAARVAEVIGVDASRAMVAEARRRADSTNTRFFEVGDLDALPAAEMDGATAIWVFQHILDDTLFSGVLDSLWRILRPGGSLYCIDRLCREPVDHGESSYLRLRTRAEYQAAFLERGFALRAYRTISVGEQVLGRAGLTDLVKRGLPLHGMLSRLDVAWAARQERPLIADSFWHWIRPTDQG